MYPENATDLSQVTDKLSHNVVLSTPRHERCSNSQLIGTDCTGCCKSNYHKITTMMAPNDCIGRYKSNYVMIKDIMNYVMIKAIMTISTLYYNGLYTNICYVYCPRQALSLTIYDQYIYPILQMIHGLTTLYILYTI